MTDPAPLVPVETIATLLSALMTVVMAIQRLVELVTALLHT